MDDEGRCGSKDRILAEGLHPHVFVKLAKAAGFGPRPLIAVCVGYCPFPEYML
jgi:hypothetical protein